MEGDGMVHRVGLPPVVGKSPKVLILGTMLSEQSYQKQEYYGNPRNQFWRLTHNIFGQEPDDRFEKRMAFLKERRIALWDVLHECDIDGSDDGSIIKPVANDIQTILRSNKGITHIFFNGQKAEGLFERSIMNDWPCDLHMPLLVTLPSSSPANTHKFEKKLEAWKVIKMALES
jgi:TDG/mug DNA glycosylase family protein